MYVIAGLGNPKKEYENTRHNVGFAAVDLLAQRHGIRVNEARHRGLVGKGMICGQKAILLKPLTYMNLSGESIRDVIQYYKLDVSGELIVLCDDINLDPGVLRVRKKGSAGRAEKPVMDEAIGRACDAVETILSDGPDAAMNRFNAKP